MRLRDALQRAGIDLWEILFDQALGGGQSNLLMGEFGLNIELVHAPVRN